MEFASFSHTEELYPWCCQKAQSGIDCYSSFKVPWNGLLFETFFKGFADLLPNGLCPWLGQNLKKEDPGAHQVEGSLGRNAVPRVEIGNLENAIKRRSWK